MDVAAPVDHRIGAYCLSSIHGAPAMPIILSLDVSCGASRIRRAINDVAGVEDVQVFEDSNRIVVTGWADVTELVSRLERRLRRHVDIVNSQEAPRLQFSSDDEDESSSEESSSEEEEDDRPENPLDWWPYNPTGEWYGMGLPARRVREPQSFDYPVPDPSSWFFNFTLADPPPPPRRNDGAGPSGTKPEG